LFSLQDGPEVRAAHDRIDVELQNCRAAMTWCLETGEAETGIRVAGAIWRTWWYALANGERPWHERLAEGRRWLIRTLEMRDGVPLPVLIQALTGASELAGSDGDYFTAVNLAGELLERSVEEGNTLGIFYGQFQLGTLALRRDDHLTARDRFLAALAVAPGLPEPENRMSQVHALIAEAEEHLGDMRSARAHCEEAMTLARMSANPYAICLAGPALGRHLREAGELARAAGVQAEAISGALAQRRPAGVARALADLAMIAQAGGHPQRGQRLLDFARQLPGHAEDGNPERGVFIADEDVLSNDAFVATGSDGVPVREEALIAEIDELVELLAGAAPGEEPAPDAQPFGLTRRELEVLRLLAEGRSNRAIAEELSLSERTVEHHLLHVYTKLGLESRAAAVAFALRHGLA
jgi:DNA-binding CsgD family transcriptional regulator